MTMVASSLREWSVSIRTVSPSWSRTSTSKRERTISRQRAATCSQNMRKKRVFIP